MRTELGAGARGKDPQLEGWKVPKAPLRVTLTERFVYQNQDR